MLAFVATPPSPHPAEGTQIFPLPIYATIVPWGVAARTRWSPVSDTPTYPNAATTPCGAFRVAAMALPLSPHFAVGLEQRAPVPMMVAICPAWMVTPATVMVVACT